MKGNIFRVLASLSFFSCHASYGTCLLDLADDNLADIYSRLTPVAHRTLAVTCKRLYVLSQTERVANDLKTKVAQIHRDLKHLDAILKELQIRRYALEETFHERSAIEGGAFVDPLTFVLVWGKKDLRQDETQRRQAARLFLALERTQERMTSLREALYPPKPPQPKSREFPLVFSLLKWLKVTQESESKNAQTQ